MENIQLFNTPDIFNVIEEEPIHIRIIQRTSRKYITTIQGLKRDLNLSSLAKYMRKAFHCQADVFIFEKNGVKQKIIKLQGDQRDNIKRFLIAEQIVPEALIKVHGF